MSIFMNITKPHSLPAVALALLLAMQVSAALAHGGEDHAEPAAAEVPRQLAPRTEAHTEDVELLAVQEGGALTLYLADYRTNAPISGAEVEVESGNNKAVAQAVGAGTYKASAAWLDAPGQHSLVVSVQGEHVADLLEARLEVPAATPAHDADDHDHRNDANAQSAGRGLVGLFGGVVLALIAIGLAAAALRARRNKK